MKLALIGVGLIGGSFARAALAAGAFSRVAGYDIDAASTEAARRMGAITEIADSVAAAVKEADVIMVAVPVGQMPRVMQALAPHVLDTALITDVGSTKVDVIAAARASLGRHFGRFVPGHPIAGREQPGVEASDPRLFRGKLFISAPTEQTEDGALATIESLWRKLGCRIERMDADEHDRVFAAVSHLPHLLAFALVGQIASAPDAERKLSMAGAGFRDFTRIAASSPTMWSDVCLANRVALGVELASYRALLDRLHTALEAGDATSLTAVFREAADCRRQHAPRLDAE